uniref:AP-4 complex accessory subunit RUSC2 n=1 Tax=Doryrhamphus excisus TaxID=161450 RepID=UPI0025AD9E67|nr:AP-4 complex accessory subunit RUSC2 [Doryrhamphus excisus]XP_057926178.1 AP-4 complex accessory subunit RUSC2 [Doryrhamphus excisus]XP_057926179.1 AP-4 complex accessory subunit RUSC2 [Doryrhamphus excisus]
MDDTTKLSGETLIVHHIPLVHCQVPGARQGGSLKRSNPFSLPENLGLSRTTSLPERDVLQREALLYSSLIQTSSAAWGARPGDKRGGGSTASDSSFASSISDEQLGAAHTLPRAKSRRRSPLRRNPFLLKDDDEDEDEDDQDNLSGYHEDSSFCLHADSALDDAMASFHLHDLGLAPEPFLLHGRRRSLGGVASDSDPGLDGQRRHGSSGSNMSVDCGEQDWEDDEDEDHPMQCGRSSKTGSYSSGSSNQHCSCCSRNFPPGFPDAFAECQQGYGSDSSCNSSDGVLVNFSAIYNKMNNGVPEKPPGSAPANLNSPACASPVSDTPGRDSTGGAFYLDLHSSPAEAPGSRHQGGTFPHLSSCSVEAALELDANCNAFHPSHGGPSSGELASCLQSRARLVVATQNYYKLVTCDLSSQSSPSPAGSSVHSGSEEHSGGSPAPTQPSEYFLFRQRAGEEAERVEEDEDGGSARRDKDAKDEEEEDDDQGRGEGQDAHAHALIQGQVYVNASPPVGRLRSRSYDRHLDKSPPPRLGSLERMLSCPVRLSEGGAMAPPPPPRVTSFAEIARSKRRHGGSPSLKADPFSSTYSAHSSAEFCPVLEKRAEASAAAAFAGGYNSQHEGGPSGSCDVHPPVVRYSKDQRPTTLPIQPFTFHHQLASKPPQPKPLPPLLTGHVSGMQAQDGDDAASAGPPPPDSVRPSPLGSYSPVHLQEAATSSGTCSTCTPSPAPAHNLSCPLSAGRCPQTATAKQNSGPLPPTPPPASLGLKRGVVPPMLPPVQGPGLQRDTLSPLGCVKAGNHADAGKAARMNNAHHLSPQALKWREYRRQNPLGGERPCGVSSSSSASSSSAATATGSDPRRPARRNVFDFPLAPSGHPPGRPHVKPMQQSYGDFLPDYFSLTERPPEEFCLSPDASSSSFSSSSSSQPHVSVDLMHKRGLVKAVNTAVDLIVAHFGTSRDPDVKAKLGNSWVSPNVGHLILKYLCPALHEVLQDGLKAYVLDLIIGQRRCQPWSLVEASTQLGPSTRVLHNLFSKVSQFSELTNHSMRLNAFIFGLLNLKSLEFWFSHLFTHEDIIAAHYSPWGLLPLSQGACQHLYEELLLLLQPLSLLPFHLDLLFEPHLLQRGEEHLRRKEQLCSAGQSADRSGRSTFQLMRGWSATVGEMVARKERAGLRREGTWPRVEASRGAGERDATEGGLASLWKDRGAEGGRVTGVGQEREERRQDEDARKDRQAGWWYQLMQSSQVYIDPSAEGSKFVKTEKRRTSSERRHCRPPPTREGVVEGAESRQEGEGRGKGGCEAAPLGPGGRPSWMGSPPESVLSQEKGATGGGTPAEAQQESPAQTLRWGRLFGASVGSPTRADATEQKAKAHKTRPPSGWLGLDGSVLGLMAQTIGAGGGKKAESPAGSIQTKAPPTSPPPPSAAADASTCDVRALCHHIATEPGQLSFNKGDVLRVLSKADPDWLLCSMGAHRGLVPIVYVTLCSAEDSQYGGR